MFEINSVLYIFGFYGDRIQWNLLGLTSASDNSNTQTFQRPTSSQSSGYWDISITLERRRRSSLEYLCLNWCVCQPEKIVLKDYDTPELSSRKARWADEEFMRAFSRKPWEKSFERYMRAGVLWFHWTGSYRSRLRGFGMYSSDSGYCLIAGCLNILMKLTGFIRSNELNWATVGLSKKFCYIDYAYFDKSPRTVNRLYTLYFSLWDVSDSLFSSV
jgi:hypothetical protein